MFKSKFDLESTNSIMKVVGELIYICSEKSILKVDKNTGELLQSQIVFPKNRRSREFFVDGQYLYCREFCTFYKIDTESFSIVHQWELGTDLSSDICGIDFDEKNVYAGIRNGPIAVIDKVSKEVAYHHLTDSSIWHMVVEEYIYAGNVNGELLKIDKTNFELLNCEHVHKKNLRSLLVTDNTIYTASQDLSFNVIDKESLRIITQNKRSHKMMFYLLGLWNGYLITVSPPCREMKLWNISDQSLHTTIPKASWSMQIDGDIIYLMDSKGVSYIELKDLIN